MLTRPAPVKVNWLPASWAGPDATANSTARPELAVALKLTVLVRAWSASGGKVIACAAGATTRVLVALP